MTAAAHPGAGAPGMAALSGRYVVRPGRRASIAGGRPQLAAPLLRGQPAHAAAPRLSALFALCARAHALCAELAVTAAGAPAAVPRDERARTAMLAGETITEHLRRIWLDWPARLAGDAPRALPDAAAAGTREWVERHVLDAPAGEWLARWESDPRGCLAAWSARAATFPALLLRQCRAVADDLCGTPRALRVDDAALRRLADAIASDPGFAHAPLQDGAPAETGVWTRSNDPCAHAYDTAWLRLGARVAELARLLTAGNAPVPALRAGALTLRPGEAFAWCEMARGVLMHWVRVAPGDDARIEDYRVVAPTEWNFHPDGALAHALSRLDASPGAALAAQVGALMGAFDPCIAYAVDTAQPAAGGRDDDLNEISSTCMK